MSEAYELSNRVDHVGCTFLGTPQNFARKEGERITFNEVQNLTVQTREHVRQVEYNLSKLVELTQTE